MRIDTAIKHFESDAALARELGLTHSVVYNWRKRRKKLLPELYARQLHDKTNGKLKFDPKAYERRS